MRVALVCIAKKEENYIEEWIKYHLKIGFDHIYVYQNDWRFEKDLPSVTKFELDGINKQREAYNDFIKKYHDKYDWIAFFDVDEFLVLKKHNDVKLFLNEYIDYDAVGISWVLFGNNNLDTVLNNDYSLIRRFTKREKKVNTHVKCIIKSRNSTIMDIHNPSNTRWVDPNKNINHGPFASSPSDNIAQLNHYFSKTKEEFIEKCNRGRADTPAGFGLRTISDFNNHNTNEIEDLTILNIFYDNNNILNA